MEGCALSQLEVRTRAIESTRTLEIVPSMDDNMEAAPLTAPVLLRLNRSDWKAPAELQVNSRFGSIVRALATPGQLQLLEKDDAVASIELSRDGGHYELATSARQIQAALIRSTKNFSYVHNERSGFGVLDIVQLLNNI